MRDWRPAMVSGRAGASRDCSSWCIPMAPPQACFAKDLEEKRLGLICISLLSGWLVWGAMVTIASMSSSASCLAVYSLQLHHMRNSYNYPLLPLHGLESGGSDPFENLWND